MIWDLPGDVGKPSGKQAEVSQAWFREESIKCDWEFHLWFGMAGVRGMAGKVVNCWFCITLKVVKVLIKVKCSKSIICTGISRVNS